MNICCVREVRRVRRQSGLYSNIEEIKKLPGVRNAFVIERPDITTPILPGDPGLENGIAILADTLVARRNRRRKQLKVEWNEGTAGAI